jgi:hypothetical protein
MLLEADRHGVLFGCCGAFTNVVEVKLRWFAVNEFGSCMRLGMQC